jgi:hypothetical protein
MKNNIKLNDYTRHNLIYHVYYVVVFLVITIAHKYVNMKSEDTYIYTILMVTSIYAVIFCAQTEKIATNGIIHITVGWLVMLPYFLLIL